MVLLKPGKFESWEQGNSLYGLTVFDALKANQINRLLGDIYPTTIHKGEEPVFKNLTLEKLMEVLRTSNMYKS